jgi:transposase-like protein
VQAKVDPSSIVFTDDWRAYKPLRGEFLAHKVINHFEDIYVRGDVYTNTIEVRSGI